jgi:hypothetical protein
MKISNESLALLRAKLPRGSVPKIRARLMKKGIKFSPQYIYRCLDPAKKAHDPDIVDEAILFSEELAKTRVEREERVNQIKIFEK